MKKWIQRSSYIVVLLIITIGVLSFFFLDYALRPKLKAYTPEESFKQLSDQYPYTQHWLDSLKLINALKDTAIYNKEGIKLHAYYVAANKPTKNTVILIHGYTDNAITMFSLGYMYNQEFNYNILVPNLQYHGESNGNAIQMGWKDRLDILEWINLAPILFNTNPKLVIHGISMGAATTMMVSGENYTENIKCYIEDCGYTSVWDEFSSEAKSQFKLPAFPLLNITSWLCHLVYGWNFKEASALNAVEKCPSPMFFIHGENDTFVPTDMVYSLYQAKKEPKELWIVPNATHAVSYKENREEYTLKVSTFINKYMN